jgi:hypothetical protein
MLACQSLVYTQSPGSGGLTAYGPEPICSGMFNCAAYYVIEIKGEKVEDVPVERPSRFDPAI